MRALTLCARAYLEVDRVALRPIDEMMTIGDSSLETRGVARLQHGRAAVVELREPDDVAERGLLSALGDGAPWFGIDAFGAHHRLGNVYLRHHALLYASIDHPSVTDSVRSEAS